MNKLNIPYVTKNENIQLKEKITNLEDKLNKVCEAIQIKV